MIAVAVMCGLLALLPAVMIAANLSVFRTLPDGSAKEPISVLIPARNEESNIVQAINAVLASADVQFELIVLDDHSTDSTAALVKEIGARDPRVRLEQSLPLPAGWNGKQHACAQLARYARHDLLLWIDADVLLDENALARIVAAMQRSTTLPIDLLSGFPRELTSGGLDALLIPLIHFVLLGYLPLWQMRRSSDERLGAGCGQLFVARRAAYEAVGGHASIFDSRHDGVKLPRLFRRGGFRTDIFDATDLASCRMYSGAGETWRGLLKNADEGLATPIGIGIWTILLGGGCVIPIWLLIFGRGNAFRLGLMSCMLLIGMRFVMALRFKQSLISAIFHPLGVAVLLLIQWHSIVLRCVGIRPTWRGRA